MRLLLKLTDNQKLSPQGLFFFVLYTFYFMRRYKTMKYYDKDKEYDKYYPNRFIFNVDEMFNESVRISQKEFITKYIPALFNLIKE